MVDPRDIRRVLAPNPGPFTLQGTNTWVIGPDEAVVIDPGPDDERHLREVIREAGAVSAILVTHDHPDHAPGARRLSEWTGVPARAGRPGPGGIVLADDEVVEAGGVRIRCVASPGHTSDHFAFFLEDVGALFTGDAVLGFGTSVIDPREGDLGVYLETLTRMRRLGARVIHPGHGPLVLDPDAKLLEYVEHRAERERQVLEALRAGHSDVDSIVRVVYADTPAALHPIARRQVAAQLVKLEREGRVRREASPSSDAYVPVERGQCRRCGRAVPRGGSLCAECGLNLLQEPPS